MDGRQGPRHSGYGGSSGHQAYGPSPEHAMFGVGSRQPRRPDYPAQASAAAATRPPRLAHPPSAGDRSEIGTRTFNSVQCKVEFRGAQHGAKAPAVR